MSIAHLFTPISPTVNLSVTTSSAAVAKTALPTNSGGATHELRVVNLGNVTVFVEFGNSGVTAAVATGMPVLPNTVESFQLNAAQTHIAAITASGTSTLYATTGLGV
jgi:hypothetical protein